MTTDQEDALARLAELEDLLTVGLVEQPINGSVLSWGEAALIAHRIGRHLLRATPVADTAGIDVAWREAEAALPEGWAWTSIVWSPKHREWTAGVAGPVRYTGKRPDGRNYASADGPTPAAALLALAAALRTSKPEGDR